METIRAMSAKDFAQLRQMSNYDNEHSKSIESAVNFLANSNTLNHAYVAEIQDKVVGFVHGMVMMNVFSLQYLYVIPSKRGAGLGGKLLKTLETGSGYSDFLVTHHKNLRDYYMKFGYEYETDPTIGCKGCNALMLKSVIQPMLNNLANGRILK